MIFYRKKVDLKMQIVRSLHESMDVKMQFSKN